MSLRVLHVLDHSIPLHSGYSFRTRAILREQLARGWRTFHLTSPKHYGASSDEETVDGLHFYRTRVSPTTIRRMPVLDQVMVIRDTERRLRQVVKQIRPDVVHAHSPCLNGIAALRAVRQSGLPVVYEVRAFWEDAAVDYGRTREGSLRYRLTRALETWTLQRATAVTTICEGLRSDIVGRGIPAERVTVIPNAVNTDDFAYIVEPDAEMRHRLGLDGSFVIGFIGSFYGYEGLDILVRAMPEIIRAEPAAKLLLVGGGFEESRLKDLVSSLELTDSVRFTGRVPHAEIARYYGAVDLLAYPRKSMRLTETVTPLKPLEAMAQGRLLVASNVGGHRELIADGHTGFLFEPDRPEEVVRAVRRVLDCRERWQDIRAAGRHYVESERTWRASVAVYADVYARALECSRRS